MEQCLKCKTATYIGKTYTEVEGDQSPTTPTKVYTVIEQICRNPQCEDYKKVIAKERHLQYTGN